MCMYVCECVSQHKASNTNSWVGRAPTTHHTINTYMRAHCAHDSMCCYGVRAVADTLALDLCCAESGLPPAALTAPDFFSALRLATYESSSALTLATRLAVMNSGACVSAPLVASITLDTTFCSSHLQSALSISLAWNRGFRDACAAAATRRGGGRVRAGVRRRAAW